jgi:hypothetical protein
MLFQHPGESATRELAPPVDVEDLRLSRTEGFLCSASMQKPASSVLQRRQESTYRLCQSITATRYMNPLAIGRYVTSAAQTWFGAVMLMSLSR